MKVPINTIILGNALNVLPQLPAESVSCCICSPPYWSLRDYGIEPVIWDGDKDCKHEWGNKDITLKHKSGEMNPGKESWFKDRGASDDKGNCFCLKCNAWCGSLGLEPTFELYIKHLCNIFDEVKRVLRKDGTCFVNMGDSYSSTAGGGACIPTKEYKQSIPYAEHTRRIKSGEYQQLKTYPVLSKSLCDIPYRFSIEMIKRGWIKRNTIIWYKPNCMPASADDRFTVDFEYLFFFTKNNKAIFWTNRKTLECVDKKPLGVKGIEGKDWEWRETQDWKEEENAGYKMGATDPHRAASIGGLRLGAKHKKSGKLKKISFWTGHNYWFEQQFEEHLTQENRPDGIVRNRLFRYDSKLNKLRGYKTKKQNEEIQQPQYHGRDINYGKQGRNKRCIWIISTQPFPEAHFAVYPEGLIEIPIRAGCPKFICKKCGRARVKILKPTEKYKKLLGKSWHPHKHDAERGMSETPDKKESCTAEYNFKGYTDCGCNAGFESGIVLDPFMGAGTSALVALKQRKRFIGIEIKQEYIDMAKRRIAKVQQSIF